MDNVYKLLGESILSTDRIIGCVALGELVLLVSVFVLKIVILKDKKDLKSVNIGIIKRRAKIAVWLHRVFLTILSIFPLLGMLGTVFGLLGLDLTNGDMSNIRDNFFIALTSTAWGIIFSVFFKIFDALLNEDVEDINDSIKSI